VIRPAAAAAAATRHTAPQRCAARFPALV